MVKLLIYLCLAISAPCFAQESPPTSKQAESVEAQLSKAKQVKAEARGLKGIARIQKMTAAADAFQAVARYWPKEKEFVAEASFRRGEVLRSLGEAGAARGAFEEVVEAVKSGNDFTARAFLELGHLCRRAFEHQEALNYYRKARDCKKVSLRYRNDGREWLARLYLDVFSWKEAQRAAKDWEKHAEGPVEEVRARDLRILAILGGGNRRGAEKELEKLRKQMQRLASVPTREGIRLEKALAAMKAPKAIELERTNGR